MLAQHLYELKERDKALQAEVQDLRQKLSDSEGDIKV